jgi:phenylalanyl-tRNA synthetase alpha chain
MNDLGLPNKQAWAFGLGLDRVTMILYDIPDIRIFWSRDSRFTNQFQAGEISQFKPFSKFEISYKDISFIINGAFSYNELCSIARDEDIDNVIEDIRMIDEFQLSSGQISQCYRITYRSMDRTLKKSEVNKIQATIRDRLVRELGVKIR